MRFVYPLGLLGLIGIPILIIIYIIKNKYTEQTITSTYIWQLSERFLKTRKPISKLRGIISLIIQCLAVLVVSLIISQPVIIIPNSANEYCFILDGSGSMNKLEGDKTRFDIAKNKILDEIDKSLNGSSYNLILVGNETTEILRDYTNKTQAKEIISKLSASYVSNKCTDSISIAQEYFNENSSMKTYLVTDKDYETNNIKLINVANPDENYAIISMDYTIKPASYNDDGSVLEQTKIVVSGEVISYNSNQDLTVSLYVNDEKTSTTTVSAVKLENARYEFEIERASFTKLEVVIENADSIDLDNHYETYNLAAEHNYKALIVSDNPFYLVAVLQSYGINTVDYVTTEKYKEGNYYNYGLYIFDSYTPINMPHDGTVWFFNQAESLKGTNFTYKDKVETNGGAILEQEKLFGEDKKLVEGLLDFPFYVKEYRLYGVSKSFTTIFTCEGNPIIFTGLSSYGNREVVFGFDLHYSNLPLSFNFLRLFSNLLDYSFPSVIDKSNYVCGEDLEINVIASAKSIRVATPSGNQFYLDMSNVRAVHTLTEVGTYNVIVGLQNGSEMTFNVYSSYPLEENENEEGLSISLLGTQENNYTDGIYDDLTILFVLLGLLFIADWMVYCYEQHKLY